jgi:hypothetical protein
VRAPAFKSLASVPSAWGNLNQAGTRAVEMACDELPVLPTARQASIVAVDAQNGGFNIRAVLFDD